MGRNNDSNNVFFNNNYYSGNGKKNKNNNNNYNNQYYNQGQYYNQNNQYYNQNQYNNNQNNNSLNGQYSSYSNNTFIPGYNKDNNDSRFDKKLIMGVIAAVVVIIIIVILIFVFSGGDSGNKDNGGSTKDNLPDVVYNEESRIVGSALYGYVQIPGGWIKHEEENNPIENGYQYADPNADYVLIVSMLESVKSDEYLNQFLAWLISNSFSNIKHEETTLSGFKGYQAYAYSDLNKLWVLTIFFNDTQGNLHIVGIEGPDIESDYFKIPYTYQLTN